jgi:hypothetical protein
MEMRSDDDGGSDYGGTMMAAARAISSLYHLFLFLCHSFATCG